MPKRFSRKRSITKGLKKKRITRRKTTKRKTSRKTLKKGGIRKTWVSALPKELENQKKLKAVQALPMKFLDFETPLPHYLIDDDDDDDINYPKTIRVGKTKPKILGRSQ